MPRARTADDKFLALLARMPGPIETDEAARALAWSCRNVRMVATRLERERRVARVVGERPNGAGRPADAWSLPEAAPRPGERAPELPPLAKDTVVITPTGEEARVVRMEGASFVEFEYIRGPERFQRGVLHRRLLRPLQPGRELPEPVRIPSPAKAA